MAEPMITNTLHGRRVIYTVEEKITRENVLTVLNEALTWHLRNLEEIETLYWYRRGVCPILGRKKEIRPEINNKVVVNLADRIVTFKNGYFLTDPVSYIARRGKEEVADKVSEYNEYVYQSGKQIADNRIVDWFHTVGVGALYVEPNKGPDKDTRPVLTNAVDPRSAFVVYSLRPGNKPVMGVNTVVYGDTAWFDVFTEDYVFRCKGASTGQTVTMEVPVALTAMTVESVERNVVGMIPIIEYQYNGQRFGAFENVIQLLDAINILKSDQTNGVELAVQQLCVAWNCQFEEGTTANSIRQSGMLVLRSFGDQKADFKIMDSTLDQTATQRNIDDLYTQVLEIAGVPSSNRTATSTSDNVGAVYLRAGWAAADTACRNTEDLFRESNRRFDEVFLRILKAQKGFDLNASDFEVVFKRNSVDNILVKTQAAINMKNLGFAPEIALSRSGLSSDPITDIEVSKKYMDVIWNPMLMLNNTENPEVQTPGEQVGTEPKSRGDEPQEATDNPRGEGSGHWVRGYWR